MTIRRNLIGSAALALIALPALAADPELLVLDWSGFEDPALLQGYVEKHGDIPTYSLFGDDDEAFQKVQAGFRADVGHPCSVKLQSYRAAGLIEPWDVSRIPEFANIKPEFMASPVIRDDEGVWFIPTDWASTAIAYNRTEVPAEDVATLQVFLDPKYAGRITMPDSNDDVWALAYLATGTTDWTSATEEQFQAAAAWLRLAHENVRAYWADPAEMAQLMASGEVLVAWSWPDGKVQLRKDGFDVGFQREALEGSSGFVCGYVNFKDGPGSEDKAYDFINSWLEPRTATALLDVIGYGHSSTAGLALIAPETLVERGLGPVSVPVLKQLPMDTDLRERMVEEFERIKAGF